MKSTTARLLLALIVALSAAGVASAQGSFFTSLSGTMVDSSAAVIPGADVKIKNTGTGAEFSAVSGSDGGFTVNGLSGGTYSVTVALMGFKTAVLTAVVLNAAVPASVKVTLSVGALEESVNVVGDSALVVQTQTPSISTNLSGAQHHQPPADDPLGMTNTFSTTGTGGPVATVGSPLGNSTAGSSVDSFRLTQLLGDNTSRLMQLVWRVRW